jgi:hypothetical protein
MSKITQKVGSQERKGQKQMWTEYEPWCSQIEDYVSFGSADKVWGKRPELWPDKWIFHRDNAPGHDAFMSSQLRNPFQNSSVLALPFFALSKIKYGLKEQIFADIPNIQRNVTLL